MDLNSFFGPIIAVVLILVGFGIDGGQLESMISPTSFLIVFGGSLGAMMVAYNMKDFSTAIKAVGTWLTTPSSDLKTIEADILNLAYIVRKESILALEKKSSLISFEPLQRAVKMAVDGTEPEAIKRTLEMEKKVKMQDSGMCIKFWEDFGAFAPTIGILGAVLGLIQAMQNIDKPELIGTQIALAFTATLYGVGSANIIFVPISKKLRRKAQLEAKARDMVIAGVDGLLTGLNPKIIKEELDIFMHEGAA